MPTVERIVFGIKLLLLCAFGWWFMTVIVATFIYSLNDRTDEILWREGIAEPRKQLEKWFQ